MNILPEYAYKLILLLGVYLFGYGEGIHAQQDISLSVQVLNYLDGSAVNQATINIYQHRMTQKNGITSLGKVHHKALSHELTNRQGKAASTLPQAIINTFISIEVSASGYEQVKKQGYQLTQLNNYIVIHLVPNKLSPSEKELFELKSNASFLQKEQEKLRHLLETTVWSTRKPAKAGNSSDCSYSLPEQVYVSNLQNGYNSSASGPGYTGFIDFDLYIAGVVQGELGGITSNLETKKAQAVAARSYSLNRHERGVPVNIGQAYHDTPSESSSLGSSQSSGEVILYNGEVIDAKYSARCNGDYTQDARAGTWSPYTTCDTYGNYIPYLLSVPCSGHINCNVAGETPCCEANISTSGENGYIFGHGVGLCQRGIEAFGELFNWNHCDMLTHYYSSVCIANISCSNTEELLDCESATPIACGEVFYGAPSSDASRVYNYGCNDWTETGPERVHKFVAPYDGRLTASISNFSGDLDIYLLGSCDPFDCLGTVNSSSVEYEYMEEGKTYYFVVDADDGSGSAYELALTCENLTAIQTTKQKTKTPAVLPNPGSNYIHFEALPINSQVSFKNLQGKLVQQCIWNGKPVHIGTLNPGVYIISFPNRFSFSSIKFIKL